MKILTALFITFSLFAQQPLRRDKAAVPLTPDTRPVTWMVEQVKKIKEADESLNTAMGELIESLKEDIDLVPEYRRNRIQTAREVAVTAASNAAGRTAGSREVLTTRVLAGEDNAYGWNKVHPGLEMKLLPGWRCDSVTTTSKLIAYSAIDAEMMDMFRPYASTRWTQPILIRTDKKKIEAFKCTISVHDRFGELLLQNDDLRCDNVAAEAGVYLLDWVVYRDKAFADRLEKRLGPLGFEIPFAITNIVVVAPEKK